MRKYWIIEIEDVELRLQRIKNGQILADKRWVLETNSVKDGYIVQMEQVVALLQPEIKSYRSYAHIKVVVHSLDSMRRMVELKGVRTCEVSRVLKNHMREYIPVENDNYQMAYHILEEYPRQSGVKIGLVAIPELLLIGYETLAKQLKCKLWQVVPYWDVMAAYTSQLKEIKSSIVIELEENKNIGSIITRKGCVMAQDLSDDYVCATLDGIMNNEELSLEKRMLYHLSKLVAFCESMQIGDELVEITLLYEEGCPEAIQLAIEQEVSAQIHLVEKRQELLLRGLEQLPLRFLRTHGQKQAIRKQCARVGMQSWIAACLIGGALGMTYRFQTMSYDLERSHLESQSEVGKYKEVEACKVAYIESTERTQAWTEKIREFEEGQWLSLTKLDSILGSLPQGAWIETLVMHEEGMDWVVKGNEKRVMQDYVIQVEQLNPEWAVQSSPYVNEANSYGYYIQAKVLPSLIKEGEVVND